MIICLLCPTNVNKWDEMGDCFSYLFSFKTFFILSCSVGMLPVYPLARNVGGMRALFQGRFRVVLLALLRSPFGSRAATFPQPCRNLVSEMPPSCRCSGNGVSALCRPCFDILYSHVFVFRFS